MNEVAEQAIELPTEPTWGIAVAAIKSDRDVEYFPGSWYSAEGRFLSNYGRDIRADLIRGFVPLTDEQVELIRATR